MYLPKIDFGASLKSIFSQFYCEEFNYIIKRSTHFIGLDVKKNTQKKKKVEKFPNSKTCSTTAFLARQTKIISSTRMGTER